MSLEKVARPLIHPLQSFWERVPVCIQERLQRLGRVPSAPILIVQNVENLWRSRDADEADDSAVRETLCDAGLMAVVWDDDCERKPVFFHHQLDAPDTVRFEGIFFGFDPGPANDDQSLERDGFVQSKRGSHVLHH